MNAESIKRLDTNGEPLQTNGRYWVVTSDDSEVLIYDSLIDVDNFLYDHHGTQHKCLYDAVTDLLRLSPDTIVVRCLGGDYFKEENVMDQLKRMDPTTEVHATYGVTNMDTYNDYLNELEDLFDSLDGRMTQGEYDRRCEIVSQLVEWKPVLEAK